MDEFWELPSNPEVMIERLHYHGLGLIFSLGNKILQAMWYSVPTKITVKLIQWMNFKIYKLHLNKSIKIIIPHS